jgi:hypothetical protein
MVINKGVKRLIAASASMALASMLLVSPAQAASPLKATDFYNPLKILRIDLQLPQLTVNALNNRNTYKTYQPGAVTMSVDGRSSGTLDMEIRLKGSTSISKLSETPSFKILFPKGPAETGYLGHRRLTLNAMTQDGSKVHEYGAYALFNAMGLPASKTGWARVYVNDVYRGLYLNVEQPDERFMAKKFKDITQHIYEGVALKDLKTGNADGDNLTGSFPADFGWKVTPNKNDLTKLISVVTNYTSPAKWYTNLNAVLDRTALIKFMAVENFLSHWDGYSGPLVNNYFIRSSTSGKFTVIPWGLDQTFGEIRKTDAIGDTFFAPLLSKTSIHPWMDPEVQTIRGSLYVKCIAYSTCRTAYLTELKAVSDMATKMKLSTLMKNASTLIKNALTDQSRIYPYNKSSNWMARIAPEQTRTLTFITSRQKQVAALVKQYKIK